MCGAEFWTDHRLIISKLSIRVQPKTRTQEKNALKQVNITFQPSNHHHGKKLAIISTYVPTMTNTVETKDKFYEDFECVISDVPAAEKLIILGDFNARVAQDSASWKEVLGEHGTGKCNCNGLVLLQTCAKVNLLITNSVFHLPTRNKTSWMNPALSTGIWSTLSLWDREIYRMWESQGPCVVQNSGQIIAWPFLN